METVFPGKKWEQVETENAGMDAETLEAARKWHQDQAGDSPYRIVILNGGHHTIFAFLQRTPTCFLRLVNCWLTLMLIEKRRK